jgi:CMP-N-acetylneuraminic acid synthetase
VNSGGIEVVIMENNLHIVGIIPARGCSKGVPRKNIRQLNGKPLIYYTINEAEKSRYLKRSIVSTEDSEIAGVSREYGAEVIERPVELAQDNTSGILVYQQVVRHLEESEGYSADIIVILQPTSPCRLVRDIDEAIEVYLREACDSVIGVCEMEHPVHIIYTIDDNRLSPFIKGLDKITLRQDSPVTYRINGAIYVVRREVIMDKGKTITDDSLPFIMPLERSLDIDSELDFKVAELLLSEKK